MDMQELVMTAFRASVIYLFLLMLIRLLGKRTVGNFSAFDLIVALILGELVDEPIFGDVPMLQALLALAIVAGWHFLNSYLSYKSDTIDRLTGGQPTVLIKDGEIQQAGMAETRLNEQELWSMLRLQQIEDLRDVKKATLEPNGRLSVLKTQAAQTLEKRDLQQAQQQAREMQRV
ncbi:MAG: DUF421 domain-containing protein [Chloroflexota bacterium]|nr:DUF421 domain-containing protein [Chloroflexota bacterium]